jgi:hypothetical protein
MGGFMTGGITSAFLLIMLAGLNPELCRGGAKTRSCWAAGDPIFQLLST